MISKFPNPVPKLIKLTILNWEVQSCYQWSTTNVSIWAVWIQNFNIFYGVCLPKPSSTTQTMSTATQSAKGATTAIVSRFSLFNTSSISSLWSMVNQIQLYFLLLLTRAFIPEDVKAVITGSKLFVNPASIVQLERLTIISSEIECFDFDLSNLSLDLIGIKSDSTVFNIYPFLTILVIFIFSHLWVFLLKSLLDRWNTERKCWCIIKLLKFVLNKLFVIMTYGQYY